MAGATGAGTSSWVGSKMSLPILWLGIGLSSVLHQNPRHDCCLCRKAQQETDFQSGRHPWVAERGWTT